MTARRYQILLLRTAKERAAWRDQVIADAAERGIRDIEQHLKEATR